MTYNVFGGTLNPTLLYYHEVKVRIKFRHSLNFGLITKAEPLETVELDFT